ncbi:fibronectin type III domain-containing protein 4-like isoform X1 [Oncorhynchus tshawytscha]|uniref:fibronectin type III domain-containing protein 4-like isoform X1 n=1 Tax=Oncorhynchus tshawytscha TaxID=74940 RepID=UPI001C3C378C|nr:fibronectin type III domain-containing protein 4-like isoform X1 [Oncorhynchus tshawytscha]
MPADVAVSLSLATLLLITWNTMMVTATVPVAPVNVSVSQLRSDSALIIWSVPQGDIVIGYVISQQRQDGLMQRSIREVNSSSRACVLWDLDEDTHYSVQVQSIGLQGDSQPSHTVHFRTLEKTDHYPIGSIDDDPTMEGMDLTPNLQTGELLIVTTVLLLWAAVIALFCRQYDIIKDNDYKDKPKRPYVRTEPSYYSTSVSAQSTPLYYNGGVQGSKVINKVLIYKDVFVSSVYNSILLSVSSTGPPLPLPSSECDRISSSSSIISL